MCLSMGRWFCTPGNSLCWESVPAPTWACAVVSAACWGRGGARGGGDVVHPEPRRCVLAVGSPFSSWALLLVWVRCSGSEVQWRGPAPCGTQPCASLPPPPPRFVRPVLFAHYIAHQGLAPGLKSGNCVSSSCLALLKCLYFNTFKLF